MECKISQGDIQIMAALFDPDAEETCQYKSNIPDITSYIYLAFQGRNHPLADDKFRRLLRYQEDERRMSEDKVLIPVDCPLHVWLLQAAHADPKINVKQVKVENHVYTIIHYEDNIRWRDEATALRMIARGLIVVQCISDDFEIINGYFIYTMTKFFDMNQVSPEELQLPTDGDDTLVTVGKKYDGAGVTLWKNPATGSLMVNTHGSLLPNKVTKDAMRFIGKEADAILKVMNRNNINSLLAEFCSPELGHVVGNSTGIVVFGGFNNNASKIPRSQLADIANEISCLSKVEYTKMTYRDIKAKMLLHDHRPLLSIEEGYVVYFRLGDSSVPVKCKYLDWVLKTDIPNPNKCDESKEGYVSRVISKFSNHDDHVIVNRIATQMWDREKALLVAAEQQNEVAAHAKIAQVAAELGLDSVPVSLSEWKPHFRTKLPSGGTVGKALQKYMKYL